MDETRVTLIWMSGVVATMLFFGAFALLGYIKEVLMRPPGRRELQKGKR